MDYPHRIERIDQLIRIENTGTPDELAAKLKMTARSVYRYIADMKTMMFFLKYKPYLLMVIFLLGSYCMLSQDNIKYQKVMSGVFIEYCPDKNNVNRYTEDNEIYKDGNQYEYSFLYVDKNNSEFYYNRVSEQWQFVAKDSATDSTVTGFRMLVKADISEFIMFDPDYDQTLIKYHYIAKNGKLCPYSETTGLVENKKNIWMHPPRTDLFRILELNPFPFIQTPYKKGNKWGWKLDIGSAWGDERWIKWKGLITNKYKYEIIDTNTTVKTDLGDLSCYLIKASAKSKLGKTELTSYFNFTYGFVRLEYINIDKSKIIIQLINSTKK
jgi:hypothetical protein